MIGLEVKFDTRGLAASFNQFVAGQQKAVSRALNRTAEQARTVAVKAVKDVGYGVKASAVRQSFSIRRASPQQLVAVLSSTGKPLHLTDFGARQTKAGVSVNVKNGRKLIKGAFLATMANGHQGVYMRVGKGHKTVMRDGKKVRTGLPIRELISVSVPRMIANDAVEQSIQEFIRKKFPENLRRELAFVSLRK